MDAAHSLSALMANMFLDPKYSDMTIRCRGEDFPVHKAVICGMSPVIDALCSANMRESKENVMQHYEFDSATVERMLEFIYTLNYALSHKLMKVDGPNTANDALIAHVHVFAIADYYDIPSLRSLAAKNFSKSAKSDLQIKGFIDVVKEVVRYTSTTEKELRPALRDVVFEHAEFLCGDGLFMANMAEYDGLQPFEAEMLQLVVRTPP